MAGGHVRSSGLKTQHRGHAAAAAAVQPGPAHLSPQSTNAAAGTHALDCGLESARSALESSLQLSVRAFDKRSCSFTFDFPLKLLLVIWD